MTAKSALLICTVVVLGLLLWQLRWVLLVLFGAVVLAVAMDVLIQQLQKRSRLNRPQALILVLLGLALAEPWWPRCFCRSWWCRFSSLGKTCLSWSRS